MKRWQGYFKWPVRLYSRFKILITRLNTMRNTRNGQEKSWLRWAVILLFVMTMSDAYGQWGFGGDGGSPAPAAGDTTAPAADAGGGWGSEGGGAAEEQAIKKAPYIRFIPPYDSMREIIFYENIIEDEACENCGADSLYWRAKKYLVQRFGKEGYKKMVIEDKIAERIVLKITIPMICTYGKYNKKQEGMLEYRLSLRFKDSRYKYQFGNFVHVEVEDGLGAKISRTYHEHYMRLKKGFQFTDRYLMAADTEVAEVVKAFKKTLREPFQPDEDDW
jgi:hypothetical protein